MPELTFTRAQLMECDEEHDSPVLGCPVCFLYLLYSQPFVDVGVEAVKLAAQGGSAPAANMLARFEELRAVVCAGHQVKREARRGAQA